MTMPSVNQRNLEREISRTPGNSSSLAQLALAFRARPEHRSALRHIRRAAFIASRDPNYWIVFADLLFESGDFEEAALTYCRSISLQPSELRALDNFCVALIRSGRGFQALAFLKRVARLDPRSPRLWLHLGHVSFSRSLHEQSRDAFCRAAVLEPGDAGAWNGLASALYELRLSEAAEQYASLAVSLAPDDVANWSVRGTIRHRLGRRDAAMRDLNMAVKLAPLSGKAAYNRGRLLLDVLRVRDSIESYCRSVICEPSNPENIWALSFSLFIVDEYHRAWAMYEKRLHKLLPLNEAPEGAAIPLGSVKPRFSPERDLTARVLVWGEQGVGDEVMFGSMLREFRGWCGKMLVQMDKRLIPLFRRSLPQDVEFYERGGVVSEDLYDSHIPIGSLGLHLRPSRESFEGHRGAYLKADPDRVRALRESFGLTDGERLIGVSWRSSNPETGAGRSLPLWELAQVLGGEGRRLVNLQYGSVQEEIAEAQARCGIRVEQVPGVDCQNDLDGLAALIMACDEVVSIGNATAHLAGALGQKTTVLLPYSPSWRWMAKGDESPWYRSVRLLRQPLPDDWSFLTRADVLLG